MDREKRVRGPLRARVTRTINEAELELAKEAPDKDVLSDWMLKLEESIVKLGAVDEKIKDFMLDENCTEDELTVEMEAVEEYEDKARRMKTKLHSALYPVPRRGSPTPSETSFGTPMSVDGTSSASTSFKRKFKLPEIKLKTFNGNLKEWLGFWSQFQKIDEDQSLHDTDKFQYLVQAMVPESEPSELVKSFPQTAANYPKAVEALKKRFGRNSLLIQVYVRELLVLAFQNVTSKERIPVSKMFIQLKSHLRSLDSLNLATADPSTWLFPLVESSLPVETLRAWQRSSFSDRDGSKENPPKTSLDFLMEFLEKEVESDQRIELASNGFQDLHLTEKKKVSSSSHSHKVKNLRDSSNIPTAAGLYSGQASTCVFCDKSHPSANCFGAKKMSMQEKMDKAKAKRVCFACLEAGHNTKTCPATLSCRICSKRHHPVMCRELERSERKKVESTTTQSNLCSSGEIILPTLLATLIHEGRRKIVRVLCDTGSQHSYIKKQTAKELALKPSGKAVFNHSVFGNKSYLENHQKFWIELERLGPGQRAVTKFEVLDQDQICGEVPRMPRGPWMKELRKSGIWLSDTGNGNGGEIEILVGAKDYANIVTGQSRKLQTGLVAIETTIGWTMLGGEREAPDKTVKTLISMHVSSAEVSQLWDLETIGIKDPFEQKSKAENLEETKLHFLKSVSRTEDGRYSVKLPWIDGAPDIPDNRYIAEKRLLSSTRKLNEKGKFEDYGEVFRSWMEEGIIERVSPGETGGHFIPHHPVFKPDSTTTPVRPVYDASCKGKGSPSLNDCLRKGPNLMEEIPPILLRFRENQLGVISDIRRAFLMVGVDETDRNFLKFLWWEGPQEARKIVEFRHRRVVFGVNCSPFLLAAVLEYHLKNVAEEDKAAAEKLWKSLYVDNCVTSVSTQAEYEEFKDTATRVLKDAGMDLLYWENGQLGIPWDETKTPVSSVLGLNWDKQRDTLAIDLELPKDQGKITKRSILSAVHRVYDPLGFVSPVLIVPKTILQEVWAQDLAWDEEVDEDAARRFQEWARELILLKGLAVPRHVNPFNVGKEGLSVHVFCDASKDAYAAVIFLRAESDVGTSVRFLQAKTRVSPLNRTKDKNGVKIEKRVTIPRLELLAATIGARLAKTTVAALEWNEVPIHYWSDSTTVLAWIDRNEDWGTFVGNRVREIRSLTSAEDWKHVPGKLNPADLPSRGCSAAQFLASEWWEGPHWLYRSKKEWPVSSSEVVDEAEVAQERKKTTQVLAVSVKAPFFVPPFSDYLKNLRVMCLVLRGVQKFKELVKRRVRPEPKRKSCAQKFKEVVRRKVRSETCQVVQRHIPECELRVAERAMWRIIQREAFPNGAKDFSRFKVVEEDGLLLVKSKLTYRNDTEDFRSPILLPKDHPMVTQLIQDVHQTTGHGGTQVVLNALREKYWILQGRRVVSKVLRGCVPYKRYAVKNFTVEAAPLPLHRVEAEEAYQNVGVDLAGPLNLYGGEKSWIVIFTCAVYRAVHLDVVSSLSTETFIGALERFISGNGRPNVLHSDNGTNFVGCENLFKQIDWKEVEEASGVKRIRWIFNPPTAAWWGGWWERLIRSVKDLLRKMLGRARLTYDELRTCLASVEATMNSLPLTTVTEDPEDLIPLTPMMFTRTVLLARFPESQEISPRELQKRFKRVQDLKKDLQARFRKEYLALLVQKGSERKTEPPKVGDVVLVGSDDKKRFEWPLGRIVELIPGKDGHVRTAKVRVMVKSTDSKGKKSRKKEQLSYKTRIMVRPLQRLFPLEVRNSDEVPQLKVDNRMTDPESSTPTSKADYQVKEVTTKSGRKITRPRRYGEW